MNTSASSSGPVGRPVTETRSPDFPAYLHPEWTAELPWLVQGTTAREGEGGVFDLGLFADASASGTVLHHWRGLQRWTGLAVAVHAHQVHGATVRVHEDVGGAGLLVAPDCDGHATPRPGILLTVTTADCVPVFVVDPVRRSVALLHAGWRSAAGGILEKGVGALKAMGSHPADLRVHLGPAICYEVGPEVFRALGLPAPPGPEPVDVRGVLGLRAVGVGVGAEHVTVSTHCTLCDDSDFFSHRGGDGQRQVGFLGVRP